MTTNRVARSVAAGAVLLGGVLGLPYALLTYLGNPVPAAIPSPARIVWWLRSGQFDDHAAVAVLAYVLWACWAIFVVQVAAQLPGAVRAAVQARCGGQLPTSRTRSLVGGGAVQVLLMALLVTLFVPRNALAATSTGPVDASGPASARPAAVGVPVPGVELRREDQQSAPLHVVVHGDSLWDIAATYLGDPNRWSEIYEQNVGVPQPDGQVLTNPDVIFPGWKLTMPMAAERPKQQPAQLPIQPAQVGGLAPQDAEPFSAAPAVGPSTPVQPAAQVSHVSPSQKSGSVQAAPRDRVAVSLGTDGYVGIGLAAGVAAALAAGRLRRRARARAQFPIPVDDDPAGGATKIAAQLERAHLLTLAAPDAGYVQDEDDPYLTEWVEMEALVQLDRASDGYGLPILKASADQDAARTRKALEAPIVLAWGTGPDGDAVQLAVDDRASQGVSVGGEGAEAALRALIVAASAAEGVPDCGTATRVIMTAAVVERVFGTAEVPVVPHVEIKSELSDVLNEAEDEISERRILLRSLGLRNATDVRRFKPDHLMQPLLLVTMPPSSADDVRLTDVIEAGQALDIHAMLLGPAPGAAEVRVEVDGTTYAKRAASSYDSTRAFHMSTSAAQEALGVLFEATPAAHAPTEAEAQHQAVPPQRASAETRITEPSRLPEPPVRIEVFDGLEDS